MPALATQCHEVATKLPLRGVTRGQPNGSDESGAIVHGDLKRLEMVCRSKGAWLELALSRLQHDQTRFSDEDHWSQPLDDKSSKKGKRRAPRRNLKTRAQKQRPPSLCATHPSLYEQMAQAEVVAATSLHASCVERSPSPDGKASQESLPPWQDYSDAKRMAGYGDPSLPNPTPRMLKVDTRSRQTNVVSPTFLIGLPCGGLVEAATFYEDSILS